MNKGQNCHVSLFQILSAMFFAIYYLNWFTDGEVIAKIKGLTFF